MSIKLVLPDGKEITANQVKFTIGTENFSEYKLEDGNTLKVRVVVGEIYRSDQADPLTGRPNYIVKSTNIISVEQTDKV